MSGKYSVIRSESKLKDLDPEIQKLFDQKHVKIIKAGEAEAEEAEKTQEELIAVMCQAIIDNAENIKTLISGEEIQEEEIEESQEENLEKLTKSLEESGLDLGLIKRGRRRKVE